MIDYTAVGGKKRYMGHEVHWDFGYKPEFARNRYEEEVRHHALKSMPRFTIDGVKRDDPTEVLLYKSWSHPKVVEANGFAFEGIHQLTGSCVGAGGGTCVSTLGFTDAVLRGDAEEPLVVFWLLSYGRSRFYLGDRSPGEGSTGSTFAKAAREDGFLPFNRQGLPQPQNTDMLIWGAQVEMSWSDGDAQQTMSLLDSSRKHLVKTTAQCQSADDVRDAIRNGYPCTCASMYAHDGGRVQGTPAVLLARRQGQWSHQMSIVAWMLHPQFGELFYLMNQWGKKAHGSDPYGAPAGGVWITKADMDWICRDEREVYTFSGLFGFPAREVKLDFYV